MCNKDFDSASRQTWRETDGFAIAGDMNVGKAAVRDWNGLYPEKASGQAESPLVRFHAKEDLTKSPSYTPLFVQMMIELYSLPERRGYYLHGNVPPAQAEIISLLRRARVVVLADVAPGAVQVWTVDEEALQLYVDQVCSVQIPRRTWVKA